MNRNNGTEDKGSKFEKHFNNFQLVITRFIEDFAILDARYAARLGGKNLTDGGIYQTALDGLSFHELPPGPSFASPDVI